MLVSSENRLSCCRKDGERLCERANGLLTYLFCRKGSDVVVETTGFLVKMV